MVDWLPWRRGPRQRSVAPNTPVQQWPSLPAMQRSLPEMEPTAGLDSFRTSLTTARNSGFVSPLGRLIDDTTPALLGAALSVPPVEAPVPREIVPTKRTFPTAQRMSISPRVTTAATAPEPAATHEPRPEPGTEPPAMVTAPQQEAGLILPVVPKPIQPAMQPQSSSVADVSPVQRADAEPPTPSTPPTHPDVMEADTAVAARQLPNITAVSSQPTRDPVGSPFLRRSPTEAPTTPPQARQAVSPRANDVAFESKPLQRGVVFSPASSPGPDPVPPPTESIVPGQPAQCDDTVAPANDLQQRSEQVQRIDTAPLRARPGSVPIPDLPQAISRLQSRAHRRDVGPQVGQPVPDPVDRAPAVSPTPPQRSDTPSESNAMPQPSEPVQPIHTAPQAAEPTGDPVGGARVVVVPAPVQRSDPPPQSSATLQPQEPVQRIDTAPAKLGPVAVPFLPQAISHSGELGQRRDAAPHAAEHIRDHVDVAAVPTTPVQRSGTPSRVNPMRLGQAAEDSVVASRVVRTPSSASTAALPGRYTGAGTKELGRSLRLPESPAATASQTATVPTGSALQRTVVESPHEPARTLVPGAAPSVVPSSTGPAVPELAAVTPHPIGIGSPLRQLGATRLTNEGAPVVPEAVPASMLRRTGLGSPVTHLSAGARKSDSGAAMPLQRMFEGVAREVGEELPATRPAEQSTDSAGAEPGAPLDGAVTATPAAAAPEITAATSAPKAIPAEPNIDDLANRLYEPLATRLKAELWLDRERAGQLTSPRHGC